MPKKKDNRLFKDLNSFVEANLSKRATAGRQRRAKYFENIELVEKKPEPEEEQEKLVIDFETLLPVERDKIETFPDDRDNGETLRGLIK